ncbi:hypothetical protein GCM10027568_17550 [Humibacter soli]
MPTSSAQHLPVLVLDFDGTVCIGDAPVWAYAEAAIAAIPADIPGRDDVVADIRTRLSAFLDGAPGRGDYLDGYAAVAALTAGYVTAEQLDVAYLTSRQELASGALAVSTPPGLARFLDEIGRGVERVLVTNSPRDGVAETLGVLGLRSVIDRVVTDAGKPTGWERILPELLAGRPADALMSVGDIWRNDLALPAEAGCATAFIDRFGTGVGHPSLVAPRFEDLYLGISSWAADPSAFVTTTSPSLTHPPRTPTHEGIR